MRTIPPVIPLLLLQWFTVPVGFGQSPTAPAQGDTGQVVILSDRVGPVIDREERDRFHLFSMHKQYVSAVVLQRPDSTFVVRFTIGNEGSRRDSLVPYGEPLLRNMAEVIDHIEEIEAGTYRIGEDRVRLKLLSGAPVIAPALPARPSSEVSKGTGNLPLSLGDDGRTRRPYPFLVDFGVGCRYFSPAATEGTASIGLRPLSNLQFVFTGFVELAIVEWLSFNVEAGTSFGETGYLGEAGVLIYFPLPQNRSLRPFAGFGLAWCTVADAGSGLEMAAGAGGVTLTAGFEFVAKDAAALDVFAGFIWYPTLSTGFSDFATPGVKHFSLDPSGWKFGIRIKLLQ